MGRSYIGGVGIVVYGFIFVVIWVIVIFVLFFKLVESYVSMIVNICVSFIFKLDCESSCVVFGFRVRG